MEFVTNKKIKKIIIESVNANKQMIKAQEKQDKNLILAARSAAESAESAARSAAWSAAESTRSAAWSAAWSVAWSVARPVIYKKYADKLLELMKECK